MRVAKNRRREHKTDYLKRLKILKSDKPRVIFRRTNTLFITQYITSEEAQDKILFGLTSQKLIEYGWPKNAKRSLKSTSAAYLIGYLMGRKIIKKKLEEPIVDFGMLRMLYKSKTYAFLKGLIDAGIKINCKKEAFPDEKRIKGEHMKNKISFDKIKSNIDKNE